MAISTRLCATAFFLVGASATADASSSGTIHFRGAVLTPTVAQESSEADTPASSGAPHRVSVQTLDAAGAPRGQLLDYFVERARMDGIPANRLRLVTVAYD
jgi:hypothetical protein